LSLIKRDIKNLDEIIVAGIYPLKEIRLLKINLVNVLLQLQQWEVIITQKL
jgi:hypothetical protein